MNLPEELPDPLRLALERTPARLLVGRHGPAYPTATWLRLRADHAAARDAVQDSVDLNRDLKSLVESLRLYEVRTRATNRHQYIGRPDLGRKLDEPSRELVARQATFAVDFQVVLGDGLSARAVTCQVPELIPLLADGALARGWKWGRRVGFGLVDVEVKRLPRLALATTDPCRCLSFPFRYLFVCRLPSSIYLRGQIFLSTRSRSVPSCLSTSFASGPMH
ncbi:MAG: hypothetical protein EBS30_12580 [Planctomycetes bacterium]|nr:hypothetical protein [Planctomycetota bacterium]